MKINVLASKLGRVTSSGSYIPQIDGLRFLAIVPVLFWHAGLRGVRASDGDMDLAYLLIPQGHIGVDLFFFVSGFIIAYPFLSGRAPSLKDFYFRRITRLEPPYFIVMIGCFMLLAVSGYQPGDAPSFNKTEAPLWQSLLASLTYSHALIFGAPPKLNPPAWSLEVEIWFYILAPFLLTTLAVLRPNHRILAALFFCAAGIAVAELVNETRLRYTLLGHSYGFFLGFAACQYAISAKPFEQAKARSFDIIGLAGIALLLLTGTLEHAEIDLLRDGLRVAAISMIFIGSARGEILSKMLANPVITVIGGACYSIYLTHVPVMQGVSVVLFKVAPNLAPLSAVFLSFLVLIPIALLCGMLFYVVIERPCMKRGWYRDLFQRLRRVAAPVETRLGK